MANVENETVSGSAKGMGVKVLQREDDAQMDPAEFARLLDIYDNSFRNIAEGEVVKGTVLKVTASEVVVDVGYKSEGIIAVDEFVDENGEITVKRGNIVLSRKALLEEENAEKKKHTLETLAEGKVLKGVVKNITDYGAFIDLGGIDGLLHITDMSWGRVGHPSELFKVNDEIDVIILNYDPATA